MRVTVTQHNPVHLGAWFPTQPTGQVIPIFLVIFEGFHHLLQWQGIKGQVLDSAPPGTETSAKKPTKKFTSP